MKSLGIRLLCGLVLLVLLFPVVSSGPLAGLRITESNYTPSELLLEQMVPDTNITSPPAVVINGSSGEYSSNHHPSAGAHDPSYINLTWNHVANTSLDFRNETTEIYPDCNDFIYFYQEMPWTHDQVPTRAKCQIEYLITKNGTFEEEILSSNMADIYVWLNDSSGNWWEIGRQAIHSYSDYTTFNLQLDYWDIREGWQGLTDYYGPQEDPEDVLTLAIGLSPSLDFMSYSSTEPWRIYNGSVTLSVRYMFLETVLGISEFEHGSLENVWESRWHNPYSIWFEDMAITDDGSLYTLGRISDYERQVYTQLLVKWDEFLNPQWGKTWAGVNGCSPCAVATYEDAIFTLATSRSSPEYPDILLTKWNSSGHRLWHKYIDLGGWESPFEFSIGPDGAIYIVGHTNESCFLVKLDSCGQILWSYVETDSYDYRLVEVDENGTIYALNLVLGGISKWNSSGHYIEQVTSVNPDFNPYFTLGPNGDIYTLIASYNDLGFNITRVNVNGTVVWNEHVELKYSDLWSERIYPNYLAVDENGEVFVIAGYHEFQYAWVLFKFDDNGVQEWNKTVLSWNWFNVDSGIGGFRTIIAPNGLLYISGTYAYLDDRPFCLSIATLNPNDVPLPTMTTTTTTTSTTTTADDVDFDIMILVIGGGAAIVIIVLIIILRRMKSAAR